jgi:hypothetical protein
VLDERGLLGLVIVGDEASKEIRQDIVGAAMTGVLDLAHALELIVDGLDDGAFAPQQLVGEIHERVAHVLAERGNQPRSVVYQEPLGEGRGDVARSTEAFAEQTADQAWNGSLVVGIARSETKANSPPNSQRQA